MNATRQAILQAGDLVEQAFSRAAGAPLIAGNKVRLLRDATENYPAWLGAIEKATRTIHCESYIIHDDDIGRQFADALSAKARQGIQVRLIYDWMGALGAASWRFWKPLRRAGVDVRCFNPPRFGSRFGWLSRDHRKMLTVDGQAGFITGLCVGRRWVGDPQAGLSPWRDTGVEIEGPAVAAIECAFADMWSALGPPIPEDQIVQSSNCPPYPRGVALRIVASSPYTAGLYRFDQFVAALAQRSIWLTDAYYLGTTPYVQALAAAARDGVDVRLLVPHSNDIPLLRSFSRNGYAALLEAGVRVFEWNGPMLHAKTAVVDGRWARVGSSNLNPASWIGNWELDVVVEDKPFAEDMEEMYLEDLDNSTELVLRHSDVRAPGKPARRRRRRRVAQGSGGRAVTSLLKMGATLRATMATRRVLGHPEMTAVVTIGLVLLAIAVAGALWPPLISMPVALLSAWGGASLLTRAWRNRRQRAKQREGNAADLRE